MHRQPSSPVLTASPAIAAITAVRARFGATHACAAWALLEAAGTAEAGLYLPQARVCDLCGVATWPGARPILAHLAECGLLCYFTGTVAGAPAVHILFADIAGCATSARQSGASRAACPHTNDQYLSVSPSITIPNSVAEQTDCRCATREISETREIAETGETRETGETPAPSANLSAPAGPAAQP